MGVRSPRHQAVLEELGEWWKDISEKGIGSRVVLVEVPSAGIFRRLADLRQAARAGAMPGPWISPAGQPTSSRTGTER
jgi:hypothetical protein